jgi:hypothetical protein
MSMKKLVTNWALPDRTAERTQLTLRLDFDLYARLHALKEIYPKRSVNDMINDILKNGLDEIIEALPSYKYDLEDCLEAASHTGGSPDDFTDNVKGPRPNFDYAYRRILETKAEDESSKLEVLQ